MKTSSTPTLVKTDILGVGVTNASKYEILEYIKEKLEKTNDKLQIVTPNPEIIVYAIKHPSFKKILDQAQISLPDGVGIMLAGVLLGKTFQERITGVDFMDTLCEEAVNCGWTVGLLGAKLGIAQKAADLLKIKHHGLKIYFADAEWPIMKRDNSVRLKDKDDPSSSSSQISNLKPLTSMPIDILFVAFGFPKQEEWIAEHLLYIPVRLAMGVGGAFDYISGSVSRAPFIIRSVGLEWLYRLILQPWRIKRQLALVKFIWVALKDKFSS